MGTISKLTETKDTVTNITVLLGLSIINILIASFIVLALINGIQ